MNLVCDNCGAEYRIDASKVPKEGGFITCKSCSHKIKVRPEEEAIPLAGSAPEPTPVPADFPVPTDFPAPDELPPLPVESPLVPPAEGTPHSPDDLAMVDNTIPTVADDDLMELGDGEVPAATLGADAQDLPVAAHPFDLPESSDFPATLVPDEALQQPAVGQGPAEGLGDLPTPSFPTHDAPTYPGIDFLETDPPSNGGTPALSADDSIPGEASDLPALAESELPPLAADDLPPLPEAEALGTMQDLSMPSAPVDLPAPGIGDVGSPAIGSLDDLPAPSQIEFDGAATGGLSNDLFSGAAVDSDASALNDHSSAEAAATADFPALDLSDSSPFGSPGTASQAVDASEMPEVETPATPVVKLAPDGSLLHDHTDHDSSSIAPKKRKIPVVWVGVLAAIVLAAVGVSVYSPELIGLGGETTQLPKIPANIPEEAEPEREDEGQAADETKPEPPPQAPKLTPSNVHALPLGQLRPSLDDYVASESAAPGLTLFGYFRLAYTFGDEQAVKALLELAPKKVNPAKIDDDLFLAGALGSMIVSGKGGAAKKLGERVLKSSKADSALVEYVTGLAYEGKPPTKALKHFTRAVELDPGLIDASIARAELLFQKRGAEDEAEQALSAAVAEVPGPAIALRAARILINNERFSAIDRIGKPLISPAQSEQLARADRSAFFTLLIAKNVWVANLPDAEAAAKAWAEVEPSPDAIIAHARLASANKGEPQPILREGIEALETDASKAQILHELSRIALSVDSQDEAKSLLEEIKALPGKDTQGWVKLVEGDILAAKGQAPKAKAAYAASGRGRAKFVEPRLAALKIEGGASGANLAKLTQLEKRSNHAEVVVALADALHAKGNFGGAASLYEKALWISAAPIDPLGRVVAWARSTAAAGDSERAYEQLREIQKARPKDAEVVGELVRLAQKMGRADEAVGWYEDLLSAVPDNLDYQVRYAGALNDAGKFSEAQTLLEKLHRDNPEAKSGKSLAELGRAVMEKDQVRARSLLTEAKSLEPSAEIYSLLAQVEARQQRYDSAIVALQEAVKLSGGDATIRLELGLMQLERGNPRDAVDNLKRVLRAEPGNVRAVLALGDALGSVGKHKEALQNYQKAIRSGSRNVELQLKAALIQLQQLNQLPQAVKGLRKVLQVAPDMAEVHYYLGYAYKDMDRAAEARSSLQKFLEIDPNSELASEVKQELKNL